VVYGKTFDPFPCILLNASMSKFAEVPADAMLIAAKPAWNAADPEAACDLHL